MPVETEFSTQIVVRVKKPVAKWLKSRRSPLNPARQISREVNIVLEEKYMEEMAAVKNAKAQGAG